MEGVESKARLTKEEAPILLEWQRSLHSVDVKVTRNVGVGTLEGDDEMGVVELQALVG